MTDGETWDGLVEDWQAKPKAFIAFPLFRAGMKQNTLLDEFEELRVSELVARRRMDEFIRVLK